MRQKSVEFYSRARAFSTATLDGVGYISNVCGGERQLRLTRSLWQTLSPAISFGIPRRLDATGISWRGRGVISRATRAYADLRKRGKLLVKRAGRVNSPSKRPSKYWIALRDVSNPQTWMRRVPLRKRLGTPLTNWNARSGLPAASLLTVMSVNSSRGRRATPRGA